MEINLHRDDHFQTQRHGNCMQIVATGICGAVAATVLAVSIVFTGLIGLTIVGVIVAVALAALRALVVAFYAISIGTFITGLVTMNPVLIGLGVGGTVLAIAHLVYSLIRNC